MRVVTIPALRIGRAGAVSEHDIHYNLYRPALFIAAARCGGKVSGAKRIDAASWRLAVVEREFEGALTQANASRPRSASFRPRSAGGSPRREKIV